MRARWIILALPWILIGCQTPKFPDSGTVTPFDGKWADVLHSEDEQCNTITIAGEIRYGFMLGKVNIVVPTEKAEYTLWGQLKGDGTFNGRVGSLGVAGAWVKAKFTPRTTTGTWSAEDCQGSARARKLS